MNVDCTALREKCETDWMVELRSVYPYGLNDRCKGRDWRERGEGVQVGSTLFKKLGHFLMQTKRAIKISRSVSKPKIMLTDIHEICRVNCSKPSLW